MPEIELKDKFDSETDLCVELDTESETFDFTASDPCESGFCELGYKSARILAMWILDNLPNVCETIIIYTPTEEEKRDAE